MTKIFLLSFFLAGAVAQADVASAPKAGDFDTYTLAISYHNDYCLQYPKDAECLTQPVLQGLSLHGLWPDRADDLKNTYGYCDLPASAIKPWCSPKIDVRSKMSPDQFTALEAVQPEQGCLYNHEWYAHGACSGLAVGDYFSEAATLAERFRQLPHVNELVRSSAGKTVDLAPLQEALEQDLGPESAGSAVVLCREGVKGGAWYFYSFSVSLDKRNLMEFPAAASFAPLKPFPDQNGVPQPNKGNCPATGIHVAP